MWSYAKEQLLSMQVTFLHPPHPISPADRVSCLHLFIRLRNNSTVMFETHWKRRKHLSSCHHVELSPEKKNIQPSQKRRIQFYVSSLPLVLFFLPPAGHIPLFKLSEVKGPPEGSRLTWLTSRQVSRLCQSPEERGQVESPHTWQELHVGAKLRH